MELGFTGKTALVLAGGGGLGSAIAKTLSQGGARVALADIDRSALDRSQSEIRTNGGEVCPIHWDLGDQTVIEQNVTTIERLWGPVDILINNTGAPPPTPAIGQSTDLWTKSFQAMVLSVIGITDRIVPNMRSRKWGRIVTSTSSGVVAPIPNLAISNALRLSLVGWSKTLAREVARDGVTVNVVVPGRIATERIKYLDGQKANRESRSIESVISESIASIPIGRYGDPQEYANVVAFLASDRASYVTGSVVRVDGGLIANT